MSPKNRASGIVSFSLALGLLLLPPSSAWPQTVIATVSVGPAPFAVAVNEVTNKIYVANCGSPLVGGPPPAGTVTVIDGHTNTTTTVRAGICSRAVAVNPVTNKIYVANRGFISLICGSCIDFGSVTVIDGSTNSTTTVTDPNAKFPQAVAVNPLTNKIYVANWSGNVTVIDGATNSTTTVTDPNAADPIAAAVNSVTNKIYVTNIGSNNVTVIDGASNSTTTISDPNMSTPNSVAVNPVTNKIYVANVGVFPGTPANVTVIDGATNSTTTITDPNLAPGIDARGFSLAVNSATNKIYVADESDSNGKGHVSVIDVSTNSVVTVTDPDAIAPVAVAVDPATNTIYVANGGSLFLSGSNPGSVTVIDGATDSITTVVDPKADVPNALAVNPVTNTIYVANFLSANVTVIRGATGRSPGFTLSVTGNGNGSGTVTSNPAGIECPVSCSASFLSETTVTLAATPHATSNFTGWTGACSSTSACSITMDAAASVTAIFTLQDFSVTPASTKLIVQPGAQATDVMSLAGLNGPFGNAIQLTCATTGPSPAPTCTLSAASVTPGANSSTSTLTITAPAAAAMRLPSSHPQLSKFLYAMWLPLVFGITVVGEAKKIPRRHWILYGFLTVMFISQTACGGGNSSSNSVLHQAPTNYTVTVTGASGAIQHTTQIAVTVQ